MKSKILFFTLLILILSISMIRAQQPVYPKPNGTDQIPFGKKLPPPSNLIKQQKKFQQSAFKNFDLGAKEPGLSIPEGMNNKLQAIKTHKDLQDVYLSGINQSRNSSSPNTISSIPEANPLNSKTLPAGFHLTKDINTATVGSYPGNSFNNETPPPSFAVLNDISYFSADDGLHGSELWRSDGTDAGTYMVKDINPGDAGSGPYWIISANGKLYFSAYTDDYGWEPWVSDGTEEGTKILMDINSGPSSSYPEQFVKVKSEVIFSVENNYVNGQLWKTDGTTAGTSLVYDFNGPDAYSGYVTEATVANNLYFFSAWTPEFGRELWRSDGTAAGTFMVKDLGPDQSDNYSPLQLTAYNNKLYFSGDDGTGRKLWYSDGTPDGTGQVLNTLNISIQSDLLSYTFNYPFSVLNNVLYLAGYTNTDGSGLYKYDASSASGIELVKDIAPTPDWDFIFPGYPTVVDGAIFFMVANSIGDQLWISKGNPSDTKPVKQFAPGIIISNFYAVYNQLYFVNPDPTYGAELWKSDGTEAGTVLLKDIYKGPGSSYPYFVTPFRGKVLFGAIDAEHGAGLWISDGTDQGTSLVTIFNYTYTSGSDAGFMYRGLSPLGNGVVFNAYTPQLGGELYKSDGTASGTKLLNDIATGTDWSYPNDFVNKDQFSYFIADDAVNTGLYLTDGTTAGLKRITYIDRNIYYVVNFSVTDNGLLFYILGNKYTGGYELWRSNGTDAGSYVLNTNIYYNDYVITIGNTGFFVAGDDANGYELWKSDGTVAGTKLVKDINPGFNGSYPYSLFAYKNNLYFGAYDGTGFNNSFWKSDGTKKGTVKLATVTSAYFYETFADPAIQVYCISNDKLYFSATDFNNYGAELWVTNGNANGTKMVKDINPYYSSYPNYLTDVKGTLYFTADDGVHGTELWSSNGKPRGTNMVKDITPDYGSYLYNLCSAGGKLYFLNGSVYPATIWSSDGTESNTNQVADAGLDGLNNIKNLTPSGNKLFFGAYTDQYGTELYEGDARGSNLAAAPIAAVNKSDVNIFSKDITGKFDAIVYPNPTNSNSSLQIKGNGKDVGVTITDMAGKVIWQMKGNYSSQINLPVEKLSAGVYIIKVTSGADKKILKLLKE